MKSARKRHVTLLFVLAGIVAVRALPAEEVSGDLAPSTPIMSGVLAGSVSTAPTPDPVPARQPATAYAPPNAAQLIQLLAPIAVFPDSLMAEVLAAATYPDQVVAADAWLSQNEKLTGAALQQALDRQNWDDGVKALAMFPEVLHQMAKNPQWTAALGEAYINDPVDVMNAVQALRLKALANGNLKSNKYLTVTSAPNDMTKLPADASADPEDPSIYEGPAVVPPPERIVEIAPADPDNVYVPYYDPGVFYGAPIGVWPGYAYAWPAPVYFGPGFGAFAFGTAIAIDIGFGHSWGWHSWHTRWGPGYYGHGWRGPTVVHDNHPYFNHSDRIVNHFAPHESFAPRHAEPAHGRESVANAPARAGFNPEPARRAEFSGNRVAPANFNQMPMPHFDGAMAQRGNAIGGGGEAVAASRASAHHAALASSHYAPPRATSGSQRPNSSSGYGHGQGFDRGAPMQSRAMAQRPMPAPRDGAPESFRGDTFARRGNEAGNRSDPPHVAPRGGGGGGRAGNAGHR
ncbi:MAG: DUF3300 domain-containing protein [Dokdonella sp.]